MSYALTWHIIEWKILAHVEKSPARHIPTNRSQVLIYELRPHNLDRLPDAFVVSFGARQRSIDRDQKSLLCLRPQDEHNPRTLWIDVVCIYQDRYRSKWCRNLRCGPQFCEGVGFAHLACRIRKFTLRVFIMEIYQSIASYLHLTIPPSRRLARSPSQCDHVSLL